MKKIILLIVTIFFSIITFGCSKTTENNDILISPISSTENSTSTPSPIITAPEVKGSQEQALPEKVNLSVPFVSQAPFRVWDSLHNDACEEAAVLSLILYRENKNMDASQKDQAIKDMINWQQNNFGGSYELPIAKVQELVKSFYNRQSEIINDTSVDSIKKELVKGNPIIVPLAGRVLGNPYFKNPGPVYHMLVIRGYDDKKQQFITNDVGTNTKGENFSYKYQTITNAIHDMPTWQENKATLDANPEMIFSGKKLMLIIK